jgi:UDP-3-O-[3-hydroxymyristoyl] glucosamine N-acyltransferase
LTIFPLASPSYTSGSLSQTIAARLVGRADLPITGIAPIELASPSDITFIRDERFARRWESSSAGAAVVLEGLDVPGHDQSKRALLFVKEADLALAECLELLAAGSSISGAPSGIHPSAVVHPSAKIHPTASIGPLCSVGPECTIGPATVLYAGVVMMDRTIIGARCIIQPGVIIGGDGFSFRPSPVKPDHPDFAKWPGGMKLIKLPHLGNVVIGDEVEIGAGTCIDRGRLGSTSIGDGTKVDNLVQIAHNCRIGKSCVLCGQAGLAGSVTLGDWVQIGGGAGIADNLTIGSGAKIAARSAVMNDVPAGETWAGVPAMAGKAYLRGLATLRRLAKGG